MVEPDIMVDKWGPLEFQVLFDHVEHNRVFEDHGMEVVETVKGKTVQTNGDVNGDGRHVQEGLGQRPKREGLIYTGNDPEQVMLNLFIISAVLQHGKSSCGRKRSECGGKICAAAQQLRAGDRVRIG